VNAAEPGRGTTALMFAAANRRTDAIRALLAAGATVDAASKVVNLRTAGATSPEEEAFLARYRVRSGDHSIATRLPFFRAGYAAFRLGYATLAGEALAESTDDADIADAARFAALRQQYARALRRELRAVKPAPPSLNHATSPYIRTAGVGGSYSTSADDPHGRPQTG